MVSDREVIVVAGVGDLGRYVCEELQASSEFEVVVLTRGNASKRPWLESKGIRTFATDYTTDSLLQILNSTNATTVISVVFLPNPQYVTVHSALLAACQRSNTCKRLIPSEWGGDIETYPLKPTFYATSREPFRHLLRAQTEVSWTLFNFGWLADYFLPSAKTYIRPVPDMFPVDANEWQACVRGSGDEAQSWTCGRDVGKAVVELCKADDWEQVTYVVGEWSTFNQAIKVMEKYHDRSMPRTQKPWHDIQRVLDTYKEGDEITAEQEAAQVAAQVEESTVLGCLACPRETTLRQREKYFSSVRFRDLEQLLQCASEMDFV